MAFLRIVRDKRGYEYFSLVHQASGRRGKVRQQLLYWFRTPPNLKVGRQALDDEVMRALEAQNPDVQFDWDALRDTPPLPPSAEPWRERRRAERAARQLRDTDDEPEAQSGDSGPDAHEGPIDTPARSEDDARVESPTPAGDAVQAASLVPDVVADSVAAIRAPAGTAGSDAVRRRRHRRRGRRGPPGLAAEALGAPAVQTAGAAPASTERGPSGLPDEEE